MWGLYSYYLVGGELEEAYALAEQLHRIADPEGDVALALVAHNALAAVHRHRGQPAAALAHYTQAANLFQPERDRELAAIFGQDLGVVARLGEGLCHWLLGQPDRALARHEEALLLARKLGHPYTLVFALGYAAVLRYFRQEPEPTRELARELIEASITQRFPLWRGFGMLLRGWAESALGGDGAGDLQAGIGISSTTGARHESPLTAALFAEVFRHAGQPERALRAIERGLEFSADLCIPFWDPELLRLRGETLLDLGEEPAQAEPLFRAALEKAEAQGAAGLALRVATSLARLLRATDRAGDARSLLAPLLEPLAAGGDTVDLRRARGLLEEPPSALLG